MIYQHIYSRCNRGFYSGKEGFDTAAKSSGLPDSFVLSSEIKSILHYPDIDFSKYPSSEYTDSERNPEIMMYKGSLGVLTLCNSVIASKTFGSNAFKRIPLFHQYVLYDNCIGENAKNPQDMILGTPFITEYDELTQGSELCALYELPLMRYELLGPLKSELGVSKDQFRFLMKGLLQSFSGSGKNLIMLLDLPPYACSEKAKRIMAALLLLVPNSLRERISFCTYWPNIGIAGSFNVIFCSTRVFSKNNVYGNTALFDYSRPAETPALNSKEDLFIDTVWSKMDSQKDLAEFVRRLDDRQGLTDSPDIEKFLNEKIRKGEQTNINNLNDKIFYMQVKLSDPLYQYEKDLSEIICYLEQKDAVLQPEHISNLLKLSDVMEKADICNPSLESLILKQWADSVKLHDPEKQASITELFIQSNKYIRMTDLMASRYPDQYYELFANGLDSCTTQTDLLNFLQERIDLRGTAFDRDLFHAQGEAARLLSRKILSIHENKSKTEYITKTADLGDAVNLMLKSAGCVTVIFNAETFIADRLEETESAELTKELIALCRQLAPTLFYDPKSEKIKAAKLIEAWYGGGSFSRNIGYIFETYESTVLINAELKRGIDTLLESFARQYKPDKGCLLADSRFVAALLLPFMASNGSCDFNAVISKLHDWDVPVIVFAAGLFDIHTKDDILQNSLVEFLIGEIKESGDPEWKKPCWKQLRSESVYELKPFSMRKLINLFMADKKLENLIEENLFFRRLRQRLSAEQSLEQQTDSPDNLRPAKVSRKFVRHVSPRKRRLKGHRARRYRSGNAAIMVLTMILLAVFTVLILNKYGDQIFKGIEDVFARLTDIVKIR